MLQERNTNMAQSIKQELTQAYNAALAVLKPAYQVQLLKTFKLERENKFETEYNIFVWSQTTCVTCAISYISFTDCLAQLRKRGYCIDSNNENLA